MTHSATLLVLDALACFRLTRLMVADTITAPLRDRAPARLREFITCPWCVSVWLAGAIVALQALASGPWLYASAILAFSAVAGLLAELT